MSTLRTAAQQALEALESAHGTVTETDWKIDYSKEIAALRAALAEPNAEYERGVIDGMQRQAQSSVDRAVNRMAALAEPVQEPVAWMFVDDTGMRFVSVERPHKDFQPLYATPIQRLPVAKGLPRKLPEDNDE